MISNARRHRNLTCCAFLILFITKARGARPKSQMPHLSRVIPKLFDQTICSTNESQPILTLVSSCPCFLQYDISTREPATWNIFFVSASSYIQWQRQNFSGVPQHRAQYSLRNVRTSAGNPAKMAATNVFDTGLFGLVVQSVDNTTQCLAPITGKEFTRVVFEPMPEPCPIRVIEPNQTNSRIVGGTNVNQGNSPDSFKWMALIWETTGTSIKPVCGGAQFEKGFVVTAAHCGIQRSPHKYQVSLGRDQAESQKGRLLNIRQAFAHPDYETLATKEVLYDAAVLELEDGGSDEILALNQDAEVPATGEFVTAAGFGHISEIWNAQPVANRLLRVDVPVSSLDRCQDEFKGVQRKLHLCAGYETGGCDSCQADSGGPLRFVKDGRERLVGIVSFGIGCARSSSSGVYTRVSTVAPWLTETVTQIRKGGVDNSLPRWAVVVITVSCIVAVAVFVVLVLFGTKMAKRRKDIEDGDGIRETRNSDVLSETGVSC